MAGLHTHAAEASTPFKPEKKPMSRYIQIAPGVLFAAEVLSAEWGREHRQNPLAAQSTSVTQSTRRATTSAISEDKRDAREANIGQIELW